MKISKEAINLFRVVCRNETATKKEDVKYKITRNFELGKLLKVLGEDKYIKHFGTFCMVYDKGVITAVYHDKTLNYRICDYAKYKYDFAHGRA